MASAIQWSLYHHVILRHIWTVATLNWHPETSLTSPFRQRNAGVELKRE